MSADNDAGNESIPSGDGSLGPSDVMESDNSSSASSLSFTHHTEVADCHLKNFNHVLKALKSAAERLSTSDRGHHKYASLQALLVEWEDDDMGVSAEVNELAVVLRDKYDFHVRQWRIPTRRSTIKLTQQIANWTDDHENEDHLLLVYYAGHGRMDAGRQAIWSNRRTRDERYAELKWTGCEEILHESVSDVLILLDCCHAASASSRPLKGFSETIAASGFEYVAPPPGPHSFTNAITRILYDWSYNPNTFTVAALHAEIIAYLKIIPPGQLSRDGIRLATSSSSMEMHQFEWRRTPVHYVRSNHNYTSSIVLGPKPRSPQPFVSLNETLVPKPNITPRVVLSISLTEDIQADDAESCRRWLTGFPLPTQDVVVEAVFRSFSTVVLLSVPLKVWDVLDDMPGCNFVCYSQSHNILGIQKVQDKTSTQHVASISPDPILMNPANDKRHIQAAKLQQGPGHQPQLGPGHQPQLLQPEQYRRISPQVPETQSSRPVFEDAEIVRAKGRPENTSSPFPKRSSGRRKSEVKPINDDRNRSVTFLKLKDGLFKKAYELSVLCSVDVAVFVFGSNQKLYEFSSSNMRELIKRHKYHGGPNEHKDPSDFSGAADSEDDDDDAAKGKIIPTQQMTTEVSQERVYAAQSPNSIMQFSLHQGSPQPLPLATQHVNPSLGTRPHLKIHIPGEDTKEVIRGPEVLTQGPHPPDAGVIHPAADPSLPALLSSASSFSADAEGEFLQRPGSVDPASLIEANADSRTRPAFGKERITGYPLETLDTEDSTVQLHIASTLRSSQNSSSAYSSRAVDDNDSSDSDEGLVIAARAKRKGPAKDLPAAQSLSRIATSARRKNTQTSVDSTETAKKINIFSD